MSNMNPILVKDDAATPKEWTFNPVTDTPFPFWRGVDATAPIEGLPRITCQMEKLKSGSYKISCKLEVPVMETLGASGTAAGYVAPPKVAYVMTAITTLFADKRSTQVDRANAIRMMVGLLQGAGATTGTGTLVNTAAGSAFQNLSGVTSPITKLFADAILPA